VSPHHLSGDPTVEPSRLRVVTGDDAPTLRSSDPLSIDHPGTSGSVRPAGGPLPPGSSRTLYRLCGIDHEDDLVTLLYGWTRSFVGLHPRFAFKSRLGEGSQGFIFGIYDRDCRREVAFKTLNSSECDPGDISRFINEAQITAQLEHPGIIPVHDFGVMPSGAVYYTMKRVQGQSLAEYFSTRFGHEEHRFHLLEIFLRVCETAAYAHSRGVIHRDLKPRNIMVGTYGEVLVIDWGLAKVLSGSNLENAVTITQMLDDERTDDQGTRSGQAVGTPAYMSPEQARGEVVDARCDIYSLGVILYEILTGNSPYQRGDVRRTLDQVSNDLWLRLDRHAQGRELSRGLVAIVHKAMAHFPHQRYQTVDQLIADLHQYIAGHAVSAYRETLFERSLRLVVRNRRAIWVIVLAALLACAFIGTRDLYQARQNDVAVSSLRVAADASERRQEWQAAATVYSRILALRPNDPSATAGLDRSLHTGARTGHESAGTPDADHPLQDPHALADQALRSDDAMSIQVAADRYAEALQQHPDDALLSDLVRTVGGLAGMLSEGAAHRSPNGDDATHAQSDQALIRSYRASQMDDLLGRIDLALAHGAPLEAQRLYLEASAWLRSCPSSTARCAATHAAERGLLAWNAQWLGCEREVEDGFGPASVFAAHLNASSVLHDHAATHGQAQSHAIAGILGGEEGIEHAGQVDGRDADAIVVDGHQHAITLPSGGHADHGGATICDLTHGFAGVDQQVADQGGDLRLIGQDQALRRAVDRYQAGHARKGGVQQAALDGPDDGEWPHLILAHRIGEAAQRGDDAGDAPDTVADTVHRLAQGGIAVRNARTRGAQRTRGEIERRCEAREVALHLVDDDQALQDLGFLANQQFAVALQAVQVQGAQQGPAQVADVPGLGHIAIDGALIDGLDGAIEIAIGRGEDAHGMRTREPYPVEQVHALGAGHALIADNDAEAIDFGFDQGARLVDAAGGADAEIVLERLLEVFERLRLVIDIEDDRLIVIGSGCHRPSSHGSLPRSGERRHGGRPGVGGKHCLARITPARLGSLLPGNDARFDQRLRIDVRAPEVAGDDANQERIAAIAAHLFLEPGHVVAGVAPGGVAIEGDHLVGSAGQTVDIDLDLTAQGRWELMRRLPGGVGRGDDLALIRIAAAEQPDDDRRACRTHQEGLPDPPMLRVRHRLAPARGG
jgi:hypothetical protein